MTNELKEAQLFVYGTLRRGSAHPMAGFLEERGDWIGAARVRGRLYDMGPYPGYSSPRASDDWVFGDVFALRSRIEETLATLDAYEGEPYERIEAIAMFLSGEQVAVWLYLYRMPVEEDKRIVSGDWLMKMTRGIAIEGAANREHQPDASARDTANPR